MSLCKNVTPAQPPLGGFAIRILQKGLEPQTLSPDKQWALQAWRASPCHGCHGLMLKNSFPLSCRPPTPKCQFVPGRTQVYWAARFNINSMGCGVFYMRGRRLQNASSLCAIQCLSEGYIVHTMTLTIQMCLWKAQLNPSNFSNKGCSDRLEHSIVDYMAC